MKNRIILKSFFPVKTTLFILMLLFSTTFLNAQTVTFAQFFEKNGTNDFVFKNNGGSASFSTIFGGSPINFTYQNIAGLPAQISGIQSAHIFVSGTTTTPAFINATRTVQPFDQTFTIQILRDTAAPAGIGTGSRTNLLTAFVTVSGISLSDLSGNTGASSAAYTASTPNQVVTYTSDFIDFGNIAAERNLALSFSSVEPSYMLGGGGFLTNFTAAGSGTFASNPGPTYMPPSAAPAIISGRVLNPNGRGIANARVTVTDSSGNTTTRLTNSFGYYRFLEIESGQTVIFSVFSKQYVYAPKVLNVSEELDGFDFIPQ